MNLRKPFIAIAAVAAIAAPAAIAHRQWMIASSTVVSGTDNWVSIDAAVSNEIFYFDHRPLAAMPTVTNPDGSAGTVENHMVGKLRATFDVHLTQQGTYRVAIVNDGVFGSYKLNGETRQLPRGTTAANLAERLPAGATEVRTSEMSSRNELFITQGAPTASLFQPTGKGIELVPVVHPNDLVADEDATFKFMLDGKPAANLTVTVIAGGIRYRDSVNEQTLKTDAEGAVTIKWQGPGMYWLNVTTGGGRGMGGAGGPGAASQGGAAPAQPAAPAGPPARRASYVTTLEVQAP